MKTGNKYELLYRTLAASGTEQVSLTFGEIEALLGQPLPPSARSRRDWWGNRRESTQASAWMEAGYHVVELDLPGERVRFGKPARVYQIRREGDTILWDRESIKGLRQHLGFSQAQLAEQLGVRQQTISEWETGMYTPSRATRKYLTLVAERAGFLYGTGEAKTTHSAIERK